MIRPVASIGLAIALMAGAPAHAQALYRDRPLDSLLKPRDLSSSKPLLPVDKTGSPCARAAPSARSDSGSQPANAEAAPSKSPAKTGSGGSGPGEYAHYLPGAAKPKTPTRVDPVPNRDTGVDRPLYGGTDRPLWDTVTRPATTEGSKPVKPGQTAASNAPPATTGLPRDKPLWSELPASPLAGSAASASPGSASVAAEPSLGLGLAPCSDSTAPLSR